MTYLVRLFSLGNTFKLIKQVEVADKNEAEALCSNYAKENNFTDVKFVDDEDYTIRVTARTPGGRHGRNIAVIEPGDDSWL